MAAGDTGQPPCCARQPQSLVGQFFATLAIGETMLKNEFLPFLQSLLLPWSWQYLPGYGAARGGQNTLSLSTFCLSLFPWWRLCCTNRMKGELPLSPSGFSLQAQ